jgi:hypothetical protein
MITGIELAIALAAAALVAIAALLIVATPFALFHFWMNMPVVGRIAFLSRLTVPSDDEANRRLDRVYRAYRKRIRNLLSAADFERVRRYLFLAGDSATRAVTLLPLLFLVLLLGGEAFTFAFLLGSNVSANASDQDVKLFAMLITGVLILLLAYFGHIIGGMLRRTRALRKAWPDALDKNKVLPGEKPMVDLVVRISVEEDQDRDQPRREPIDAQRIINRVATYKGDRGGYVWPTIYVLGVLALAWLQYDLRAISTVAANAASLPFESDLPALLTQAAASNDGAFAANVFFIIIFLATQAFAVREGYVHAFLGVDSKRAYGLIGGADSHEVIKSAYFRRTQAADESLTNMLARFERYDRINPDNALYLERVARETIVAAKQTGDGGKDPPPQAEAQADESNVTNFPLGSGGK